jgi:N-dimethylarginine dimethylaminohydrolase
MEDSMSLKDTPHYYHEVLRALPPKPVPPFEEETMQVRVWGRRWGVYDDVGPLKMVMVHRPDQAMLQWTPEKYDPEMEAFIDRPAQRYWRGQKPPELVKMQTEHDAMVATLRAEGVEVVYVDGHPDDTSAMYTRDNGVAVPGGMILGRMGTVGERAGQGRRGEEAFVHRKLAELGMPILRTIHGTGLFEGGSFALINERTAVIGTSYRQNVEAARQISEVLSVMGIRLIEVPLTGHSLHIDGAFVMVDKDVALINTTRLPYWFLTVLEETHIRTVEVHHADNSRVTNCLAVRPGKVLLAINNGTGTAERLAKAGIEVVGLDYGECQQNGGGIHCSTLPLLRERA